MKIDIDRPGYIIHAAALLLICSTLSGCEGRKVRGELISFANIVEETRAPANKIIEDYSGLKFEKTEDADALLAQLKDLIARIDTILAPVRARSIETKEVGKLRDAYLATWDNLREALYIIAQVLETRDQRLAMTLEERLATRMDEYGKNVELFASTYKQLMEKYGVTTEDLAIRPQPMPITPMPFSPLEQP